MQTQLVFVLCLEKYLHYRGNNIYKKVIEYNQQKTQS